MPEDEITEGNVQDPANANLSDTAKQALESLEKSGHKIAGKPESEVEKKEEPKVVPKEESKAPADEEKKPAKEEKKETEKTKVNRNPSLTPTWEVKVAEKRWEKEKSELEAKIAELSKKPTEVTPTQKENIQQKVDDLKDLAEEFGLDEANTKLLEKLQARIIEKIKPNEEVSKRLEAIELERNRNLQNIEFQNEFDRDVLPLIKEKYPNISEETLLDVKNKLHKTAFTEEYQKVSLKKIFKAEEEDLNITVAPKKKSAEGGNTGKTRGEFIDFDSMSEADFKALTPEKKLEFSEYQKKKNGKSWN